jgi:hypothetical protein
LVILQEESLSSRVSAVNNAIFKRFCESPI